MLRWSESLLLARAGELVSVTIPDERMRRFATCAERRRMPRELG
ncbi:MAG: hypothetical protein M0038_21610 [Pseudomonadota bacterium]|jgi:hypothetical protein|nr:hypothetical protein [Pseudomonadota bacterium]